mmetsp:Transcript_3800/g.11772  ORF Transcript_3800/g.11772 Transcript_3800/m.11772 type:complete len:115 (+) Transcript_3800:3-347(+)
MGALGGMGGAMSAADLARLMLQTGNDPGLLAAQLSAGGMGGLGGLGGLGGMGADQMAAMAAAMFGGAPMGNARMGSGGMRMGGGGGGALFVTGRACGAAARGAVASPFLPSTFF